ncbi:hypothetical protein ACQKGC_08330 [Allorhizobium pseudoryzae]|uniref:hypothetical protein n=1 Tax=Allorhizobium pseudoryzae TaxID=379684 RepID=UPI003D062F6B
MTVIKFETRWEIDAAREARDCVERDIRLAEAARAKAARAKSAGRAIEIAAASFD